MSEQEIIKKNFKAANSLVISLMYLKKYPMNNKIELNNLKEYNPGHLGTSMSMNFILSNLNYFLHKNNLTSKIVIGTGHSGVSLLSNQWLNGTLEKADNQYKRDIEGVNKLINDFGMKYRGEINPNYPNIIYDGGELGYSLGVSYGYSLDNNVDIIPTIIGDGEAETGTLSSSWQLAKTINNNSKVLPIINLNGLKMGSKSFLSKLNDDELKNHFESLGYNVYIINSNNIIEETINDFQNVLNDTLHLNNPLIIFKCKKGYTLPEPYEGNIDVHKNPLYNLEITKKLKTLIEFLKNNDINIFDKNGKLLEIFKNFEIIDNVDINNDIINDNIVDSNLPNIEQLDDYVFKICKKNNMKIFSPDEIYSNKFNKSSQYTIEILNENLLQAMYQGYIQSGNNGYFISYEGFMPIICSMITGWYKYLKQSNNTINPLTYILSSTFLENTYSHQNPDFVNSLYEKNDEYYNIFYPKDGLSAINCLKDANKTKNKINIINISKRHNRKYNNFNSNDIEIIIDNRNPDIIFCATGDYMLDFLYDLSLILKNDGINIKLIYVTKPQILNKTNNDALSDDEFNKYFDINKQVIYLFSGYPFTIKSLLFDRNINCKVFGYNDGISNIASLKENLYSNGINNDDIIKLCKRIKKEV